MDVESRTQVRRETRLNRLSKFLVVLGTVIGLAGHVEAASRPLTLRTTVSGKINYVVTGASFRNSAGNTAPASCALTSSVASTPAGFVIANQAVSLARTAEQTVPAGATVQKAYLYWTASAGETGVNSGVPIADNAVKFYVDGTAAPAATNVTAQATWTASLNPNGTNVNVTKEQFGMGAIADVTSIVAANPNARFRMDDLKVFNGGNTTYQTCAVSTVYANWALYIIYTSPSESTKTLGIYDGLQYLGGNSVFNSDGSASVTLPGLRVPNATAGTEKIAKTTVLVSDGDQSPTASNDSLFISSNLDPEFEVFNSFNPVNDVFNGSITYGPANGGTAAGASTTSNPTVVGGIDLDTFDLSAKITGGAQSLTARLDSSGGELLMLYSLVMMTTSTTADLGITKSAPGTLKGSGSITYNLTASNSGPDEAYNVVVSDPIPAGTTYVSNSGGGTYDTATRTVTWNLGKVEAAGNRGLSVTVSVPASNTTYNNMASITSGSYDPVSSNNTASAATTVLLAPAVSKSYSPASIPADGVTTSTLTITLNNPNSQVLTLTGALTDNIGPGLIITGITDTCPGNASFSGATITYPSGSTLASGNCVIQATVRSTISGSYPNVIPANALTTNGGNNSAAATATLTVTPAADLAIDKSGPVAVGSGGSVTYTIRVWNNGPSSVTGASVTDALPAGFTVTALTCVATGTATCGTQSFTASSVTIITGALSLDTTPANATPDGNFLTYTLTGTATANGTLSNTASVAVPAGITDLTSANNTSVTVVTQIVDAVNDANVNVTFGSGATFPVLANDRVGVAAATPGNVAVTVTNAGGLTGLSVNGNGELILAASLTNLPGTYTVTYQICSTTTTTACDTATQTITITPAAADLAVTKAQRAGTTGTFQTTALSVTQGSTVQYQIVVTNSGPSAVTNATFADAVPANLTGLSVVSAAGTGTTCTASFTGSALNGSFSGSTGQTCTVIIQGTATTTGTFTNTATVAAPLGVTDGTAPNNTSSVSTTVTPAADLAIDKSGPAAVGSGGSVTYTIRVWNNGPSSVTGASVTDALPAGFTVTALTCVATGTATCGTQSFTASSVTITTGALTLDTTPANATPDGNFLTYNLTGTATASGTLSNTASVAVPAGTTDPTPANNTSAAVVTRVIDAVNDPAVSFGFGAGGTVTVLGNDTVGGAAATTANVAVTVQNAGGITGLTVNASGQLVVPAGTPAGSYTVTYQICDATVTTACDAATVTVNVGAASADLTITKTGPAFAKPGETITYTLTVTNGGPNPATGVTVSDTLPTGLTYVSSAPAATVSGQTLSWTLGTLAANASQTITVTATAPVEATLLSTPATRTLTNTASVSSATTDPTPANNTATAVTQMVAAKLTKSVRNITTNTDFGTSGGGLPGEVLEYCIAFENLGGAALPNFVLVDHVPGNTNALITAYDADESSAATGFGVKLTRRPPALPEVGPYLSSSAADADGGSLTTTGGTFSRGTMTVTLGTLAVGESGRACFQTTIR